MNKQELLDKIASRDLVCGTVGLGYVGLPLAVEKAKAGFKTVGVYDRFSELKQEEIRKHSDIYLEDLTDFQTFWEYASR